MLDLMQDVLNAHFSRDRTKNLAEMQAQILLLYYGM